MEQDSPAQVQKKLKRQQTDMAVGEILRRARMQYGQSVEVVEANLRIRAAHIQAIEDSNIEALPGRVYAIGFVRSYAEYLDLDGDKIVELFKTQSVGSHQRPEFHFPVSAAESKLPSPLVLVGCAGLLLVLTIFFLWPESKTNEALIIPPVPQEDGSLPDELSQPIDKMPTTPIADERHRVVINVKQESWVQIRNDDAILLTRVLQPGESFYVPQEQQLRLTTGNAAGIEFVVDDKPIKNNYQSGTVLRDVDLNPDTLEDNLE